jgi:hypothetical protein
MQSHAIFECLAHNLLLLFEVHIGHSEGLRDELEEKKKQGRTQVAGLAPMAAGYSADPAIHPVGPCLDLQAGSLA